MKSTDHVERENFLKQADEILATLLQVYHDLDICASFIWERNGVDYFISTNPREEKTAHMLYRAADYVANLTCQVAEKKKKAH